MLTPESQRLSGVTNFYSWYVVYWSLVIIYEQYELGAKAATLTNLAQ